MQTKICLQHFNTLLQKASKINLKGKQLNLLSQLFYRTLVLSKIHIVSQQKVNSFHICYELQRLIR